MIYIQCYALLAFSALTIENTDSKYKYRRSIHFVVIALILISFIGFRHEVGADWGSYLALLNATQKTSPLELIGTQDPAYLLLNWLGSNIFGGIYFVNFTCATISVFCLCKFAQHTDRPTLALAVAFPCFIVICLMGFTRQGVAISLGMTALLAVSDRKIIRFIAYITVATFFHKSALVLFIVSPALIAGRYDARSFFKLALVLAYAAGLFLLLMNSSISHLWNTYFGQTDFISPLPRGVQDLQLNSAGATFRIFQSICAVAAFILIAKYRKLKTNTLWLWSIVSCVIISLFVLSFWKSTLADRLALYFLPLQLYAFPQVIGLMPVRWKNQAIVAILLGYFILLIAWIKFSSYSDDWLPYRNIIWL